MFSIDGSGGHGPVIGLRDPSPKAEGNAHVVKRPPAATRASAEAVAPPQQGEDLGGTRARSELEALSERLNRDLAAQQDGLTWRIRFSVDPETEKLIVRVIEGDTERVIRQFPPDYVLKRMAAFEALRGVLVHGEV
jgi:uncharacterized FlaG/YvyC family protein